MGRKLVPWRAWRFELEGLFRDAGFTREVIGSMDWSEFRKSWTEGSSARDVFDDEMDAFGG